ncbi:Hypothetical predicted protein [Olea europaea subsp. europaea]|uniref:Uncharacterized protein n=1 Tax=Olea europaea subsp. europaea TaxID=158383 RepID=A0A8S0SBP5_OLEEU|nr:Hypothetical predicted protein [Olea europaea subsp. europaea]
MALVGKETLHLKEPGSIAPAKQSQNSLGISFTELYHLLKALAQNVKADLPVISELEASTPLKEVPLNQIYAEAVTKGLCRSPHVHTLPRVPICGRIEPRIQGDGIVTCLDVIKKHETQRAMAFTAIDFIPGSTDGMYPFFQFSPPSMK